MKWFGWDDGDLLLNIKIQPGAKRSEFAGLHGAYLKLRIHAPAIDGRANDALLVFISHSFATAKSRIVIERGALSRMKTLRIQVPSQIPTELQSLGLIAATQ